MCMLSLCVFNCQTGSNETSENPIENIKDLRLLALSRSRPYKAIQAGKKQMQSVPAKKSFSGVFD